MTNDVGDKGLLGIFTSETLVRVLSWFLLHPDRRYFQTQLVQLTGSKLYVVQRALERIESAGLIEKQQEGRRVYYWARRSSPAFDDLRRLFIKTFALGDQLRTEFARLEGRITLAFIYGSVASGNEREGSDVDLFVVGDIGDRELSLALHEMQGRLGREINTSIYDESEFERRRAVHDGFLQTVLSAPRIWLIGDDEQLERMAHER